jgi:hypothetical protein
VRIFVGYGYNDRDSWIKELVFPLVEAFGCEVVHGEIIVGDSLSAGVRNKLLSCDALLGFLTRRSPGNNGAWRSHRWVVEELAAALTGQIPTVEIRETNVDPQDGMLGDQQRINYDEAHRDLCLVQIAQVISVLRSDFQKHKSFKYVRLGGPEQFVTEARKLAAKSGLKCQYRVRRNTVEIPYQPVDILRVSGGLYIYLQGVTDSDLVQINVSYGAQTWNSDFEPVDAITIQLTED